MACMSSCSPSVMILFLHGVQTRSAFEPAHALLQQGAALEACNQPPPGVCLLDRKGAGVYAGSGDRVAHRRITGDHHVVGDAEVTGETDHATDHAAPADGGAAGDAGAGGDGSVGTDAHVVPDHDEVVELHPLFDHGVVDGTAIDGGVGADLDIGADAYRADLRHFHPRATLGRKTETVAADHHARVQHAARADLHAPAKGHARHEAHVLLEDDALGEDA